MTTWTEQNRLALPALLALAIGAVACTGTARAQEPESAEAVNRGGPTVAQRPAHTEADVRFMQGMIAHHAQAVEMTALVPARTERADIELLARRIAISQEDEMALMRLWLEDRDEPVPGPHAHHTGEHAGMPGMLTGQEMARLRAARGQEFDRLFLELMIRHHEGALFMVAELFATDGAGQESEIFQFATHVESDQRIEISRMRLMLGADR